VGLHLQGSDWNGQVKLGNSQFIGVNYLQSVTPHLALGGEAFWLGQQRKSGAGFAARYANDAHIATAQVATTGLVSLTYLRRISEKVPPPPFQSWAITLPSACQDIHPPGALSIWTSDNDQFCSRVCCSSQGFACVDVEVGLCLMVKVLV
jgi:hypothetical protein